MRWLHRKKRLTEERAAAAGLGRTGMRGSGIGGRIRGGYVRVPEAIGTG